MKPYVSLALIAVLLPAAVLRAQTLTLYWKPNIGNNNGGSAMWDPSVYAWGATSAANAPQTNWVHGSNAIFNQSNTGGSTVLLDSIVETGWLYFQDRGPYIIEGPGTLAVSGSITNTTPVTMHNNLELANDIDWYVGTAATLNGWLYGDATLRKTGIQILTLSNELNSVSGFHLDTHYTRVYGGGTPTGDPQGQITLGSPTQLHTARLEFYPLATPGPTLYDAGNLATAGFGEVYFSSTATQTNVVTFGALSRLNRGVLSLRQQAELNFQDRQRVSFTNGDNLVRNGMLPPWVVSHYQQDFLTHDGIVKSATSINTAPDTWTTADIVNNTAARTLDNGAAVYALKTTSNITIPAGAILTNASGGLILRGNYGILGSGVLDTAGEELVVNANHANNAIHPSINANGLTLFGGGTLTVSNLTWRGDTWLQQGSLRALITHDTIHTNNIFGGMGGGNGTNNQFEKNGAGKLTFENIASRFARLNIADGDLVVKDSSLNLIGNTANAGGLLLSKSGSSLLLTNSTLRINQNITTAAGIGNTDIKIFDSRVESDGIFALTFATASNTLDIADSTVAGAILSGNDNAVTLSGLVDAAGQSIQLTGPRNTLTLDGRTVLTNLAANGLRIGSAANASGNTARIINGAAVYANTRTISGGDILGANASSNLLHIIGGNGFTSKFSKSTSFTIGSGTGGHNHLLVDGMGFSGSALMEFNDKLYIGENNTAAHNTLILRNGGLIKGTSLTIGRRGVQNAAILDGAGTEYLGQTSSSFLHVGAPFDNGNPAVSNELRVVNGARLVMLGTGDVATTATSSVGGNTFDSQNVNGSCIGNHMFIGQDATVNLASRMNIGFAQYWNRVNFATGNSITVSGPGALFTCASISIGRERNGAQSYDNHLLVENGGVVRLTANNAVMQVGGWENAVGVTATSASYGNRLIIRDNGSLYTTVIRFPGDRIRQGAVLTNFIGYDNTVDVTSGGLLEANDIRCYSPSNNFMHVHNGGILQFRNVRVPNVIPFNENDVFVRPAIIEDAVISYTNWNQVVVVRDNWHQTALCDNLEWRGHNAFRLNNCGTINTGTDAAQSPTYTFDTGLGATNYFRLEMVNGETRYRSRGSIDDTALLTIGANGSMLCSNTTAFVEIPFLCDGAITLANSTLTFEKAAEINGEVVIDLDSLPASGVVLDARDNLTLGNASSLRFTGSLPEEGTIPLMRGVRGARFATTSGLPPNWSVKYNNDGAVLHWALPRTLFIVR